MSRWRCNQSELRMRCPGSLRSARGALFRPGVSAASSRRSEISSWGQIQPSINMERDCNQVKREEIDFSQEWREERDYNQVWRDCSQVKRQWRERPQPGEERDCSQVKRQWRERLQPDEERDCSQGDQWLLGNKTLRFTEKESVALVEALMPHYQKLYGVARRATSLAEREGLWKEITAAVNKVSSKVRTVQQCLKRVSDIRCGIRRKMTRFESMLAAEGGSPVAESPGNRFSDSDAPGPSGHGTRRQGPVVQGARKQQRKRYKIVFNDYEHAFARIDMPDVRIPTLPARPPRSSRSRPSHPYMKRKIMAAPEPHWAESSTGEEGVEEGAPSTASSPPQTPPGIASVPHISLSDDDLKVKSEPDPWTSTPRIDLWLLGNKTLRFTEKESAVLVEALMPHYQKLYGVARRATSSEEREGIWEEIAAAVNKVSSKVRTSQQCLKRVSDIRCGIRRKMTRFESMLAAEGGSPVAESSGHRSSDSDAPGPSGQGTHGQGPVVQGARKQQRKTNKVVFNDYEHAFARIDMPDVRLPTLPARPPRSSRTRPSRPRLKRKKMAAPEPYRAESSDGEEGVEEGAPSTASSPSQTPPDITPAPHINLFDDVTMASSFSGEMKFQSGAPPSIPAPCSFTLPGSLSRSPPYCVIPNSSELVEEAPSPTQTGRETITLSSSPSGSPPRCATPSSSESEMAQEASPPTHAGGASTFGVGGERSWAEARRLISTLAVFFFSLGSAFDSAADLIEAMHVPADRHPREAEDDGVIPPDK